MKKILLIFFFLSSLIAPGQEHDSVTGPLKVFLQGDFHNLIENNPDTALNNLHDYMNYSENYMRYLGINGSALFPFSFSSSQEYVPFFFNSWSTYYQPKRMLFYHTRKPYSHMKFITGTSKDKGEQYIELLHTQNVNPRLNLSITGISHNSKGYYLLQDNRASFLRFSTNYSGKKYRAFAAYSLERFKISENGGIVNDDYLTDSLYKPENLNTNLQYARNLAGHRNGFINQIVTLYGKTDSIDTNVTKYRSLVELRYSLKYDWYKKIYDDMASSFYNNYYIDTVNTHDSLQQAVITQIIDFGITANNRLKTGLFAGPVYRYEKFHHYRTDSSFNSTGLRAIILYNPEGKLNGYTVYENYFSGRLSGNMSLTGNLGYNFFGQSDTCRLILNSVFFTKNPDFFHESYYSNNFSWENGYLSSQYSSSSLGFNSNKYDAGITLTFHTAKNHIYFNSSGVPAQFNPTIKVSSAEIYKNIVFFKHIYFFNRILYQNVSNDTILRFPQYVINSSLFYQFLVFKKVLRVQAGASFFYHAKYHAPYYYPATGVFGIQNWRETGGYPFVDIFVNMNLKRACIFFKVEHANHLFLGSDYFTAPHYPAQPRNIKMGVSWRFYD